MIYIQMVFLYMPKGNWGQRLRSRCISLFIQKSKMTWVHVKSPCWLDPMAFNLFKPLKHMKWYPRPLNTEPVLFTGFPNRSSRSEAGVKDPADIRLCKLILTFLDDHLMTSLTHLSTASLFRRSIILQY